MPTDLDQLQAIKSQTLAIIAELTAAPKPTYTLDGQQVAWADYLAQLRQTVAWCDDQLTRDQPFESRTRGFS
ncbi:MAG TPA: hypothetical protein VHD36_08490 [Pirellulales bacterium]|nr:hypothetical protein [Pirellulales bacterium]